MTLRGEKVILRPIRINDAPRFVIWLKDEETRKFLSANPRGISLKEENKWIESLAKKKKSEKHFAIDTGESIHIGSSGLFLNLENKSAKLGIFIGDKNYWGKGFGTETALLMLDYGFTKLKLHRIELDVFSYNQRAINLYKKAGFNKEGVKKEAVFWKGKFYDEIQMGILQKEWAKKQSLKFKPRPRRIGAV